MTFDPITLLDPRDDVAAYRLGRYNYRNSADDPVDDIDTEPTEPDYRNRAERGKDRSAAIAAAIVSGDWSDVEEWSGVHDDNVHALLDPARRGESVTYAPTRTVRDTATGREWIEQVAPSYSVANVSERKTTRGKKGTKVRVTSRGKVLVVGDSHAMDDQATRSGRIPRVVIADAIDRLRVNYRPDGTASGNRLGHVDGDALADLATVLYPDVPARIGTDQYSWSEGTVPLDSPNVWATAQHTCGISGGLVPMLDAATGPEYRTRDDDPRWFPSGFPTAVHLRRHPSRNQLPAICFRTADPLPLEHAVMAPTGVPWRTWFHVRELPSPTVDETHAFHGYRRVLRGESKARPRAAIDTTRDSFVIGEHDDVAEVLPLLAEVVRGDGKGKYSWSVDRTSIVGTLTIDSRSRMSVTAPGIRVVQCTTAEALRKRIALQIQALRDAADAADATA